MFADVCNVCTIWITIKLSVNLNLHTARLSTPEFEHFLVERIIRRNFALLENSDYSIIYYRLWKNDCVKILSYSQLFFENRLSQKLFRIHAKLKFAEILTCFHVNSEKLGSSGATECRVWTGNYNVKVWKSTDHKFHNIWRSLKFFTNSGKWAHTCDMWLSNKIHLNLNPYPECEDS